MADLKIPSGPPLAPHQSPGAARAEALRAAQRAFFHAAADKPAENRPSAPAPAQPVADAPQRPRRPGSIVDIKV